MAAAATDYFTKVGNPGTATTLAAPGHTIAGTTFNVVSTANWPTDTGVIFAVDNYTLQTVNGVPNTAVRTAGTYTEWEGTVASATSITGAVLRYGTDQNYSAGSLTRVYIPVASSRENRIIDGLLAAGITQSGGMGAITPTSVTSSGTITAANFVLSGGAGADGWNVGLAAPNTVTYNGNRSYSLVFNSTDLTSTISAGMRLRTTRTVAAPTQCTSLNGTTQYYSKSSPAGMTFTDDFVAGAWVKLTSYPTTTERVMISRFNGTSGWEFRINLSGQVEIIGYNGGGANYSIATSYQSVPLNKWIHISAQLDMSTFTATTTTSYVMLDGVDVPVFISRGGTSPTALIQAGDLQIGGSNGAARLFPGKIAQAFVTSAKLTQTQVRSIYSQGLTSADIATYSIVSAYSFNNSITDINTTNANNLTANGSAVATNADSPFGTQASGLISSTLDYGIVQSATFSTNTTVVVQVPEGCTIPTSGGVSAVAYSSQKAPYGFPGQADKWRISSILLTTLGTTSNATYGSFTSGGWLLSVPIGSWRSGWQGQIYNTTTTAVTFNPSFTALTGMTAATGNNTSRYGAIVYSATGTTTNKVFISYLENLSVQTAFTMYTIGSTTAAGLDNNVTHEIFAENALL